MLCGLALTFFGAVTAFNGEVLSWARLWRDTAVLAVAGIVALAVCLVAEILADRA